MDNTKKIHIFDTIINSNEYRVADKRSEKKLQNVDCWVDTKKQCETIPPPPESVKIKYMNMPDDYISTCKSNVYVINKDTIDAALMYEKPLVLNLADDIHPGGWVNLGSNAQEESLFRRTNYHLTLTKDLYPIAETEAIYSPDITIIKSSDLSPCIEKPRLDFIACPAVKYPLLEEDDSLSEEDSELLERKIKHILQVAVKYGHKTIIFGAMGCGAWQNPPHDVAKVFKKVLRKYDGMIENYVFAILDDVTPDSDTETESNFEIFKNIILDIV